MQASAAQTVDQAEFAHGPSNGIDGSLGNDCTIVEQRHMGDEGGCPFAKKPKARQGRAEFVLEPFQFR